MRKPLWCAALLSFFLLITPAAAWSLSFGPEVLPSPGPKDNLGDLMIRNTGSMDDLSFTANGQPRTGIAPERIVSNWPKNIQDQGARWLGIAIFSNDIGWQGTRHGNGGLWGDTYPNTQNMPIPEPATVLLLAIGMIGLAIISRRRLIR